MRSLLLYNFWRALKEFVSSAVVLSRIQKKYPSCQFYPGSYVDESSILGSYNVIFNNTSVINSVLGDHTFVQKNSMIINADVGKFCSIASNVSISLGKHPTSYVSTHPAFYSVTQPIAKTFGEQDRFAPFDERVIIGNDVWIGQCAMIMDGIAIGNGAVVGAGAVVTKNVPDYGMVAGVPAKLIRYRFDEEICKRLLEVKWWDMLESQRSEYVDAFSNVGEFIDMLENNRNNDAE